MVKDTVSAFDESLHLVHVILLICLYVDYFSWDFLVVDWSVAWYKPFDFHNVECRVRSPLVRER